LVHGAPYRGRGWIAFFVAENPATALLQVFGKDAKLTDDLCGVVKFA
jgi:hypothetical protein